MDNILIEIKCVHMEVKNLYKCVRITTRPLENKELDMTRKFAESWPELSLENLELADTQAGGYYVWRNLFSAINLLRILNKLTKWKHARTMMLVVFKSAPILKRSLRVKQVILGRFHLF